MIGFLLGFVIVLVFNISYAIQYSNVYWTSYNYKLAKKDKELVLFYIVYGYWFFGIISLVLFFVTL